MATVSNPATESSAVVSAADAAVPWTVRLFGAFQVVRPDGSTATPNGRKARALLAYVVLAAGDTVTRERLAALLWSERGEDQARASLRQTLYEMRDLTTGDAAPLRLDRTGVRAASVRLVSDCTHVRIAAESADATSLALLLGDRPSELLADLGGLDPMFDEWLATERLRHGAARRRQVLAAGERALLAHDAAGASRLAARLLSCDATDEAAARLAMDASHRLGDRDAIRQTFVQIRDALRVELEAEPSAETTALHRRLMIADLPAPLPAGSPRIQEAPPAAEDALHRTPPPAMPPSQPAPLAALAPPVGALRRHRTAIVLASVAVIVTAGLAGFALRSFARPVPTVTLEVEPLRAAPTDSAALAMRTGLSSQLARFIVGNDKALRVVDAPDTRAPTPPGWFLVSGEARSDAGLLHATIRLAHDATGPILWSRTFAGPVGEVEGLREEVASKLGDVTICALGRTNPRATTFNTESMRLLLSACEHVHMMDIGETIKLFEQLQVLQPDFAHGWAKLAAGKEISALRQNADAPALEEESERDAQRALALDPNDGEAYYARALRLHGIDRWSQQMDVLAHGHALDPANGQLDNAIAGDLEEVGRWQEAAVFHQRAVDADPFGVFKEANLIHNLGFGGDPGEALGELAIARKRFADHRAITYTDFEFNALFGDPRRAAAILVDPTHGFAMRPEQAARWSALIAERASPSAATIAQADHAIDDAMRPDGSARLALEALGMRNRVDDAFAYLDRQGPDLRDQLPTDTLFNVLTRSLRDDPRFMTVAARAGLVTIWTGTDHWPDFCADRMLPYNCRTEAQRAVSPDFRPLVARR